MRFDTFVADLRHAAKGLRRDTATAAPGDAVGKRINMGGLESRDLWLTVRVARSVRYRSLAVPRPTIYLPAGQFLVTAEMMVLHATAPFEQVVAGARARLAGIDPDVRVGRIIPFARLLEPPLARPRFQASLASGFGAIEDLSPPAIQRPSLIHASAFSRVAMRLNPDASTLGLSAR
jgi:hypothetical protein